MNRYLVSACAAAFAVSLAACGDDATDRLEGEFTPADDPVAADPETGAPETVGETEDPSELPAEVMGETLAVEREPDPVFAEARQCEGGGGEIDFTAPEPDEDADLAGHNQEVADAFIAANANNDCVFATDSGLQFRIDRAAADSQPTPEPGELVEVNYEGRLIDGEVFDSSYERGEAAIFPSDRLIPGWVEALGEMRVGEQWTLYIPPQLGYGERGTPGGPIPPNSALIFTVEMVSLPSRPDTDEPG